VRLVTLLAGAAADRPQGDDAESDGGTEVGGEHVVGEHAATAVEGGTEGQGH
jgi:hypothetical protein